MYYGINIFFIVYLVCMIEFGFDVEECGFELFWVVEYFYIFVLCKMFFLGGGDLLQMYYDMYDLFVVLMVVVVVIKMIKLVMGICLVIQCDLIYMVKQVVLFDQVLDGCFFFGIGVGWNVEEMNDYGMFVEGCFKLMCECIEVMKEMWIKEQVEYYGDCVDLLFMFMNLKLVQKFYFLIYVGGGFLGGVC